MGKRLDRFWQRVNDYGNDETRDPFSHSSSYHRHFQGYAEQRVLREDGRGSRIERTYVADYYRYGETDTAWRYKKLGYIALTLLTAAASILADSRPAAVNHLSVVGILQLLSFVPLVYLVYKLVLQVSAPRQMTLGERDASAAGFQKAALLYGAALVATAVVMPVGGWTAFQVVEPLDWAVIGLKLLSGALAFLLYFMEKARRLERVPNGTPVPSGANEIW